MSNVRKVGLLPTSPYRRYLPSAFDESMNIYEQLITCIEHVNNLGISFNELVDWLDKVVLQQNERLDEQDKKIDMLRDEWHIFEDYVINTLLKKKVVEVLKEWLEDGTLAEIINNDVMNMKVDKVGTVYVKDFKKLEDETDDTGRVKRAFEELKKDENSTLVFEPIKYVVSEGFDVPSNKVIRGYKGKTVIDGKNIPAGTTLYQVGMFYVKGTLADPIALAQSVEQGSSVLVGPACDALLPEDLLIVTSDQPYDVGAPPSSRRGEIVTVKSFDGTNIQLMGEVYFSYDQTKNARIQCMRGMKNTTIRDLDIIVGGKGKAHNGVIVENAQRIYVDNVFIDGAEDCGVVITNGYNCHVLNSDIINNTSPGGTVGTSGYGVAFLSSKECSANNNFFRNSRHAVAGGGFIPAFACDVIANKAVDCPQYAYDCHEPCLFWNFSNNSATSCVGGFTIRGQYTRVVGNTITSSFANGILVESYTPVDNQKGNLIADNIIKYSKLNGIFCDGTNAIQTDLTIVNNKISDVKFAGINVFNLTNAVIKGNTIKNDYENGIRVLGRATGYRSFKLIIEGNTVYKSRFSNIRVAGVDNVVISNNNVEGNTKDGIELFGAIEFIVNDNMIKDCEFYGIRSEESKNGNYSNNYIKAVRGENSDGLRLIKGNLIVVNSNTIVNPKRFGVYTTDTLYTVITSNNVYECPVDGIKIDGPIKTHINQNNLTKAIDA
ncbi:right-handed parallel beta-helix repeat-containing protein [Bacillus thuringiensis]|nr:right-handed parallel beta-helix repeat-containing protein [Bacillus thuringiensis]AZV00056.1 pre-neck protein appendage protein [Bacillus phage vB_BthP-HD73phi]